MIGVIGEALLDVERHAARRERAGDPFPVLREEETTFAAGGAANTAANLAALGADVALWAPVGDDPEGDRLAALITSHGVTSRLTRVRDWPTPRKERVFDGRRAVLRIDRERPVPPFALAAGWRDARTLVCADYGLGVWTEARAREVIASGRPIVADARGPVAWWRGAAAWCPNAREACAATATDSLDDALRVARAALPGTLLAVTLGEGGVAVEDGVRTDVPAAGPPAVDPVGAGDTFTAALAIGLDAGLPSREAVARAVRAAGLAAARLGTRVVRAAELG